MSIENQNVTNAINQWDFNTKHVQQNMMSGDFVGSHSCLICATVPRIELLSNGGEYNMISSGSGSNDDYNVAMPIGIVSDFSVQQQSQLQQLYEIGSKRKYTVVSGRTDGGMTIARAQYDGPSVLRMFYAFYPQECISKYGAQLEKAPVAQDTSMFKNIESAPGYNQFWLNMMSDIFTYPFGIMLVQKNSANNRDISATLFENCYVAMHQMSVSAGQVIIAESAQLTFDRVVPIKCAEVQAQEYGPFQQTTTGAQYSGTPSGTNVG